MQIVSEVLYYLREMLTIGIPATVVFACFWPYRKKALTAMRWKTSPLRECALSLFILVLFGVLAVTLWPVYARQPNSGNTGNIILYVDRPNLLSNVNLIPFRMFGDYLRDIRSGGFLFTFINFLGNLAVFVPLGFFPALLWSGASWKRSFLVGFGTSFFVECGQYLIMRFTDIDDIILNTLGAMCGYWLFLLLRRLAPRSTAKFRCTKLEVPDGRETGDRSAPHGADSGKL